MKTKHFLSLILLLSFYSSSFSKGKNKLATITHKNLILKSNLAQSENTFKFESKLLAFTETVLSSTLKAVKIKSTTFSISKP